MPRFTSSNATRDRAVHYEIYNSSNGTMQVCILKTSYKTRGKKDWHEAFFPDLIQEIADERHKRDEATQWTDLASQSYHDHIEKIVEPLVGPTLIEQQRR